MVFRFQKNMKIIILSDGFPPNHIGGAEVIAFNLANDFQKLGNHVYVITTVREKSKVGKFNYQGIKVFRIYSDYHERWRAYLSLYNPQTVGHVKKIIKQIRPDVVHTHNIHHYLSYYSLRIAKKYSKAVFLTAHDVMLFHYGKLVEFVNQSDLSVSKNFNYKITSWQQIKRFKKRYNLFRNIFIKYFLKHVDKIFAVSHALKDALNQNNIKNVEVIHNGIEISQWQVDNKKLENFKKKYNLFNKKIVFFAGRLSDLKGGEKIIKAMKIVIKQIPNVLLLVAGRKDNYANRMLKLAKKENLSIILTGWIEEDELKSAYYSSDVVVTPSIYLDPFPTVNLETMACKKPIIGTCFGGTPEIVIDNKTGYVVNPLNIELMAEKIVDLLKNPDKTEQFGKIGYNRVKQKFGLEKQINETLEWYKKNI